MSIEKMIAREIRCSLCSSAMSDNCKCWITLRCPTCNRVQVAQRESGDPVGEEYVLQCPTCEGIAETDIPGTWVWQCPDCKQILDQSDSSSHAEKCPGKTETTKLRERIAELREKLGIARGSLYQALFVVTDADQSSKADLQEEAESIMSALSRSRDDELEEDFN